MRCVDGKIKSFNISGLQSLAEYFDSGPVDAYHFAPMLKRPLPKLIDPMKLITREANLSGVLQLEFMTRLSEAVLSGSDADVELEFVRNEQGSATILGVASSDVFVKCQRCLEAVGFPLRANISLLLVQGEEAEKQVSSEYDVFVLDENEDTVLLHELVEDELLLCLPSIPMHEEGCCTVPEHARKSEKLSEIKSESSPFQVLAGLKKKN